MMRGEAELLGLEFRAQARIAKALKRLLDGGQFSAMAGTGEERGSGA